MPDEAQGDFSHTPPEIKKVEPRLEFSRLPLKDIIPAFKTYYDNRTSSPIIEYKVDGQIQKDDLQATLALPFELAFTEDHGEIVVTPNILWQQQSEAPIPPPIDPENRLYAFGQRFSASRLSGHTHPPAATQHGLKVDSLSFRDAVIVGAKNGRNTTSLLIHPSGISRYQKPIFGLNGKPLNPDRSPASEEQFYALLEQYEKKVGNVVDSNGTERNFSAMLMLLEAAELPVETQTTLTKEFTDRTGMLAQFASWDDPKINQLIMQLNLQD